MKYELLFHPSYNGKPAFFVMKTKDRERFAEAYKSFERRGPIELDRRVVDKRRRIIGAVEVAGEKRLVFADYSTRVPCDAYDLALLRSATATEGKVRP